MECFINYMKKVQTSSFNTLQEMRVEEDALNTKIISLSYSGRQRNSGYFIAVNTNTDRYSGDPHLSQASITSNNLLSTKQSYYHYI